MAWIPLVPVHQALFVEGWCHLCISAMLTRLDPRHQERYNKSFRWERVKREGNWLVESQSQQKKLGVKYLMTIWQSPAVCEVCVRGKGVQDRKADSISPCQEAILLQCESFRWSWQKLTCCSSVTRRRAVLPTSPAGLFKSLSLGLFIFLNPHFCKDLTMLGELTSNRVNVVKTSFHYLCPCSEQPEHEVKLADPPREWD